MTDEVKDASGQGTEETQAVPTPVISPASETESSAQSGFDPVAFEERITAKIEALLPDKIDARFKSTTDKSFQDVRQVAEYLKRFDGNEELAIREMAIDRLIEGQATGGDPGRSASPSPQKLSPDDTENFLKESENELGVTLTRDELTELADSRAYTSEKQWYQEMTKALVKKAKSGVVTPSAVVGTTGKVASTGDKTRDELDAELAKLSALPTTRENMIKRREILRQME